MSSKRIALILSLLGCVSCIGINQELGQDFLATNMQYDIKTDGFAITDVQMDYPDGLSGYSLYRFTFGAINDGYFGLTTRSTAFTLIPVSDSLDFGKKGTQVVRQFHFAGVPDTTSCVYSNQKNILQNVHVYALSEAMDFTKATPELKVDYSGRISEGIPIYNGTDSLSFNFTKNFAALYIEGYPAYTAKVGKEIEDYKKAHTDLEKAELEAKIDSIKIKTYQGAFPGIFIKTDDPVGEGGRINMFKLPVDVSSSSIYGSYAELKFTAEYEGKGQVDTSFIFYLGAAKIYNMKGVTSTSVAEYPQVAYNLCTQSSNSFKKAATDEIYFEGGMGVKPVIKAKALRDKILADMAAAGVDPSHVVVNKATIILPFDYTTDLDDMIWYPDAVGPTCRIKNSDGSITFAGISDSSSSDENQGKVGRYEKYCSYSPDITYHVQELIGLKDESKVENYDIWLLAMADEVMVKRSSTSNSSYSDYLQQLAYASYYNSMYNGYGGYGGYGYGGYGYGGYGGYGYGGYGDYYNNYYNYAMLSAMYSQNTSDTSVSTQSMMDSHRYYRGILAGPEAAGRKPEFRIVYSVSRD